MEHYDPFSQGGQSYLGNMEIEVGFQVPRKTTDVPYDQEELGALLKKVRYKAMWLTRGMKLMYSRTFRTKYLRRASNSSWM